jgi:hypothetical protein
MRWRRRKGRKDEFKEGRRKKEGRKERKEKEKERKKKRQKEYSPPSRILHIKDRRATNNYEQIT